MAGYHGGKEKTNLKLTEFISQLTKKNFEVAEGKNLELT